MDITWGARGPNALSAVRGQVVGVCMDSPWGVWGQSADSASMVHGVSVNSRWDVREVAYTINLWGVRGPDRLWTVRGQSVGYVWGVHGPSVDIPWTTHGQSVDNPAQLFELSMG